MNTIRLGIHGAAGRLGRRILALGLQDRRFAVHAAVVRDGSDAEGQDAGTLTGTGPVGLSALSDREVLLDCDVVIDVSSPGAGADLAALLAKHGGPPLVTGTTGRSEQQDGDLREVSQKIAVLCTGNFSLGITALVHNARETAARLGADWGVHIHDSHHSAKKDAPSGTALMLVDAICAGWDKTVKPQVLPIGMPLVHPPQPGEIIISVTREGDIVGTHHVNFIGSGETVSLSHTALSRDIFAQGALQAAYWLSGKPAGLYGMDDVRISGLD